MHFISATVLFVALCGAMFNTKQHPMKEDITVAKATPSKALFYLIRPPKATTSTAKAIVLLHGVGSNETDLFGLADQLPDDYYIISARGQYTLGPGRYAWYNVDFSTGKPVFNAEQERSSRAVIKSFIDEIRKKYQLKEIYLGGFSQGAIMSYAVGLTSPESVSGIFAIGGRRLEEIRPMVTAGASLKALPVFVAHGTADNTLPVAYAREAKGYLESLQVKLSYHEYPMGHQISAAVLKDLDNWLKTYQK